MALKDADFTTPGPYDEGGIKMEDIINHPKHYELDKIECIDAMEMTQGRGAVMSFCLCNAFKYLWRHDRKNGLEDLKKAKWYLDKYLELAEKSKKEINDKFGYGHGGYCDTDGFVPASFMEKKDRYEKLKKFIDKKERDEFDDMIDEIAAEHKKDWVPYKHMSDCDKEEEALQLFRKGLGVILFETATNYCDFRIKYSDRLLLPKPENIYGKHPEIIENCWPVVIYTEFTPCAYYEGKCRYKGEIAWAIAQSDWREVKTVSGKAIYIYGEKETI